MLKLKVKIGIYLIKKRETPHAIPINKVYTTIPCDSYYMVVHTVHVIQHEGQGAAECGIELLDPNLSAVVRIQYDNHVITNLLYFGWANLLSSLCVALARFSPTWRLISNANLSCYTCMVLLTGHFLHEIIISTDQITLQYCPLMFCTYIDHIYMYRTGSAFNPPMQSTISNISCTVIPTTSW